MKTKFYVKYKELYVLVNTYSGSKRYAVWEDARDYEKATYSDERPMVYDTLKDAWAAAAEQFISPCHTDFPVGLAIEKVEFRWLGLWKKRTVTPLEN